MRRRRPVALVTAASIALWLGRHELADLSRGVRRRLRARGGSRPESEQEIATVSELIDAGQARGYTEEFFVTEQGIRCRSCGETRGAEEYAFDSLRRVEGASDPDDAQAVLAVRCPACAAAGSLVVNYGPAASPEESDALAAMRDRRQASGVTPGVAPGEPADPATPDDARVAARAELLPEEREAGSDDPVRQAKAILADSDARQRRASEGDFGAAVEHRRSEDTVDP